MDNDTEVVLRYRDGRIENGSLAPIDPARDIFVLTREGGQTVEVPYSEMKAVFFPRSLPEELLEPPAGSTITVEFNDGEVMRGIAHYNPERNGFFLYPLDRSKNDRIYVVTSAIASIEVEKL